MAAIFFLGETIEMIKKGDFRMIARADNACPTTVGQRMTLTTQNKQERQVTIEVEVVSAEVNGFYCPTNFIYLCPVDTTCPTTELDVRLIEAPLFVLRAE